MDIRNLFAQAKELEIKLPNGESTGWTFKVVGQDSKQFKQAAMRATNARLNAPKDKKHDMFEAAAMQAEVAAACIVGWTGVEEDGISVPYSPEKALELMKMPELSFIIEQIDAFVSERAKFFRSSEASAN